MKTNKRHYAKSSSFAMAILFTILCGSSALCLGYFINYFTTGHFVHSTEIAIDAEIRYVETIGLHDNLTASSDKVIYLPFDEKAILPSYVTKSISHLSEGIIIFDNPANKKRYAAKIYSFDSDKKILVGLDITDISDHFKFMQVMGIISILFVMLVVLFAYGISVFVVGNTNKIANTAREIMETGDLSKRLEIKSKWDDLSNMALVLNQLLDRIQELMSGVRQVSDNVAHDLKTPLTRLHNKLESLEKKYGHDDYADLKNETNDILNIFNALLRISRIESEKQKSHFKDINIKNLMNDVIDFYLPLAQEKNINIQSDLSDFTLSGDKDLLFQAYANLLDNAVKFAPKDSTIKILFEQKNETLQISITNSGALITDKEKETIFKRFYRSDESRSTPGSGLGLSLVKAVIELHNGEIYADSKENLFSIITIL